MSPNNAATVAAQAAAAAAAAAAAVTGSSSAAQMALSPLQSNDSPNPNQTPQSIVVPQSVTQAQQQGPPGSYRGQTTSQNMNSVHQQQAVNQQQQQQPPLPMPVQMGTRPQFNPQLSAPPNYHAAQMGPRVPHSRWPPMRPPYMGQGPAGGPPGTAPAPPPPANNNQGPSALIAQLSQPPSAALHVQPFAQRIEGKTKFNRTKQF